MAQTSKSKPINPRTGKPMQRMYDGRFASRNAMEYAYRPSVRRTHVDWRVRPCQTCHKEFSASRRDARFCSQRCRMVAYRAMKRNSIYDLLQPDEAECLRVLEKYSLDVAKFVKLALAANLAAGRYALHAVVEVVALEQSRDDQRKKSLLDGLRNKPRH